MDLGQVEKTLNNRKLRHVLPISASEAQPNEERPSRTMSKRRATTRYKNTPFLAFRIGLRDFVVRLGACHCYNCPDYLFCVRYEIRTGARSKPKANSSMWVAA